MPIGPSSTTAPYIIAADPNISITSIATVGDTLDTKADGTPYRMVGIPDGLGAFDNGDGTFTLLMNHEIVGDTFNLSGVKVGNGQGIVREHGGNGAFVSEWIIDKTTLAVLNVEDAIKHVYLWDRFDSDSDGDANSDWLASAPFSISRLCSADLAAPSAYLWVDDNGTADVADDITYGTTDRIFMTGEEFSPSRDNPATAGVNEEILGGRQFAYVATGEDKGGLYELAHFGYFAWENTITSTFAQKKTISIGLDDGLNGQLYVYVGEKQTTGNAVEKAGLTNSLTYVIQAVNLNNVTNNNNEANSAPANGRFNLLAEGDISLKTGIQLDDLSESLGGTSFLRPEDGQFDPTNPNVFWFVTTASLVTNANGADTVGQSRLYKLTFDDITNPEAGGTIVAVIDSLTLPANGGVGPRMMDNMTVNSDGKILIQEDVGNNRHLGRTLEYDPATDTLVVLATHDGALFTAGQPGFVTQDEESSGIIEVTDILGTTGGKSYLAVDQIHNNLRDIDPELVEGGQLQLITVSDVVASGTNKADVLNGDYTDNKLSGKSGDDILSGGNGDDRLMGGNGVDTIRGGAGRDFIDGGRGDDLMWGGTGADTFKFGSGQIGNDTIYDFSAAEGDVLKFARGNAVASEQNADLDHDGDIDTMLLLQGGGSITLVNVADYAGFNGELNA